MGNKASNPAIPDYNAVLEKQNQYNKDLANQTFQLNNPNQVTPYGSRTITQGPNGQYTVNTSLSPQQQQQLDAQNQFNLNSAQQASTLLNRPALSYNNVPAAPTFDASNVQPVQNFDLSNANPKAYYDTSNLTAMPDASESDLQKTRDAVYNQQTQYLDPQFQQSQSDLEVKLANQGIMPGSDAYNREMNNFALNKQRAYSDARNSAIAAGGAEQSRLFGLGLQSRQQGVNEALNTFNTGLQNRQQDVNEALNTFNTGLQSHQQGMNDSLAKFNTGLQARQQGVAEQNALYNAPINALGALRGGQQVQMPSFQSTNGVSIPGVNYMDAATNLYNANLGNANAQNASNSNMFGGLFSLGNSALQNPDSVKSFYNWVTG